MKEIQLTQGKVALVDDDDYEMVNSIRWRSLERKRNSGISCYYANGYVGTINGKIKSILMHRLIIRNIPIGYEIDHIDRNGLNNQKSNLRICTSSQNNHNRIKSPNKSSIYKGITYLTRKNRVKRYLCRIFVDGESITIGCFKTEIEAAIAYNKEIAKYHGEFSVLNKI